MADPHARVNRVAVVTATFTLDLAEGETVVRRTLQLEEQLRYFARERRGTVHIDNLREEERTR